jgi:hypothetical protein
MGTNQKLQIVKRYRASAIALSAYKIYKKSRDGTWSGLDRLPAVRADLAALASSPGGAMTKSSMVLIAALIVGASAQLGAASEQETWIVVQSDGEERAAFVPAKEPYTEGGPAVSVYLRSKNVRAKDGLVITGFEFVG